MNKEKSKSKKIVKKDEFRKNKDNGHPSYIYRKVGNRYEYIGVTHSEITHKSKNIKLDVNPNPKDKRDAYFRPKTDTASTDRFKGKKEGWKLSDSDKKKAKEIIKKTKSKK